MSHSNRPLAHPRRTALSLLLAEAGDCATRLCYRDTAAPEVFTLALHGALQRLTPDFLQAQPGLQLFITATETPPALQERALEYRLFHVEQGEIAG